jgi:hypothetical protein
LRVGDKNSKLLAFLPLDACPSTDSKLSSLGVAKNTIVKELFGVFTKSIGTKSRVVSLLPPRPAVGTRTIVLLS